MNDFHQPPERLQGVKKFFSITMLMIALGGCSAPVLDFSLKPLAMPGLNGLAADVVVGVDRFVDLRPQTRGDDNQKWWGTIPGVLWIDIESDLPEIYTAYTTFNSRPMDLSIAETMVGILAEEGVAREVVFLPEDPYRQTDYRLEGMLHRTLVRERCYYYGSSMYAWLTRIFGMPYVSYEIELDLGFRLRELKNGRVVWQDRVTGKLRDKYNNVYGLAGGRDGKHVIAYNFSEILSASLPEVLAGIRSAMGEKL